MDGWTQLLRNVGLRCPKNHIPNQSNNQDMITSIKFDDSHDLLWIGDSRGYLYSFCGTKLSLYTSSKAHVGPVLKILNHKKGLISLSFNSVRMGSRQGSTIFNVSFSELQGLNTMSYTSNTQTELLVAGDAESTGQRIFKIDTVNHCISGYIDYPHSVTFMETNLKYVILGRSDGCVDILDPKTDTIQETFKCHSAGLTHMSVKDNNLLTTGFSIKKNQFVPDPLVNSFDLKTLTATTPIPFPAGASKVFHHPLVVNVILISSSMGHMNFIDIYNPTKLQIFQADVSSYITSFDFSSSGSFFAFTDARQNLHLWARLPNPNSSFVIYNAPLEYPTIENEQIPLSNQLNNSLTPLSSVKLPHYNKMLLSGWPADMVFQVGKLPKQIDPEIYRSSETINGVMIARYTKEKFGPRNVAEKYISLANKKADGVSIPKFISERDDYDNYYNVLEDGFIPKEEAPREPVPDDVKKAIFDLTSRNGDVPIALQKLSIIYSKFGVDDFDFDFYNHTCYSGLEINSGNSFCNPLFQLYRFVPSIFNFTVTSLSEDVTDNINILVELGYLFDMMVKANGRHCTASNFQRLFSSLPEAKRLGLINDTGKSRDDYRQRRLIETFNRFLLERISNDECDLYKTETPVRLNTICGVLTETTVYSNFCDLSQKRSSIFHSIDVNCLPSPPLIPTNLTILNYMESSMNKHVQHQIFCEKCGLQHPVNASLIINDLPPVVILNLDLSNQQMNEIRYLKGWLVPDFYFAQSPVGTPVLRTNVIGGISANLKKYELMGFTAQITSRDNESHLVTYSKIKKEDSDSGTWYLFNDFLVTEVSEVEALDMSPWWKKPVIVVYKQFGYEDEFKPDAWKENLNDSILYKDHFAKGTREGKIIEYELLTKQEAPRPGTLVALDAEFIELAPAAYEFSSDGSQTLVRPPKLSLGRISVLKGSGPREAQCFIDDYIVTTEKVHDYITSFSGIEPGDLDPETSKKSLVNLQTAYRKIWLLLNLGCVFVGHSLIGDFRMINIQVPPQQVRDTAICFYLKKEKRKLGLKYLVYQLFQAEVQTGNHDSIEDAHSALKLYKKYLELKRTGQLEDALQKIYLEGQMSRFRIPNSK